MQLKRIEKVEGGSDGRSFRLTFQTDGEPLVAVADAANLNDMMNFIGVALNEIHKRGGIMGVMQAHAVASHHTDTSEDGQHVLLQLTTKPGYTHSFVLAQADAATLGLSLNKTHAAAPAPPAAANGATPANGSKPGKPGKPEKPSKRRK